MKKIICTLMTILISFSFVVPVFATEKTKDVFIDDYGYVTYIDGNDIEQEKDFDIGQKANTVCGNLTYHRMVSSGWGWVYLSNGNSYINGGAAWQCSNCKTVMVTEGDIYFGQMSTIGKWATMPYSENINQNGCIIDNPNNYGVCNSSSMAGYKFYIN